MSYVPVYATVNDNVSNTFGHTTSRRGKVTNIQADVHTHFGDAIKISVSSDGNLPRQSETCAEMKISHFKDKGDMKKVAFWEHKLREYKTFNEIQEKNEKCLTNIELSGLSSATPHKFNYSFRYSDKGYHHINAEDLKDVLDNWGEIKEIIPKLKIAKALEDSNKKEMSYYYNDTNT